MIEELIEDRQNANCNYDRFAALVEKYVNIPELTGTIMNDFMITVVHAQDQVYQ